MPEPLGREYAPAKEVTTLGVVKLAITIVHCRSLCDRKEKLKLWSRYLRRVRLRLSWCCWFLWRLLAAGASCSALPPCLSSFSLLRTFSCCRRVWSSAGAPPTASDKVKQGRGLEREGDCRWRMLVDARPANTIYPGAGAGVMQKLTPLTIGNITMAQVRVVRFCYVAMAYSAKSHFLQISRCWINYSLWCSKFVGIF